VVALLLMWGLRASTLPRDGRKALRPFFCLAHASASASVEKARSVPPTTYSRPKRVCTGQISWPLIVATMLALEVPQSALASVRCVNVRFL
jgi:hypothetical protein